MTVDLNSKPHSLTHIQNMSYDEDNQLAVREIVGLDINGVVRKVPVGTDGSLSVNASASADTETTGSLTGAGQTLVHTFSSGESALAIQITGTWSGLIGFEGSVDGTNYVTHGVIRHSDDTIVTTTNSTNGTFTSGYAGFTKFRCTVASWTSGTANITIRSSTGVQAVHLESPIPAGTNNIGDVDTSAIPLATQIDDASSTVTYIGYADPGTSGASALWRIKKLDSSTLSLIITWADGNANYDNVWNNRASLTYS